MDVIFVVKMQILYEIIDVLDYFKIYLIGLDKFSEFRGGG